MKEVRPPERCHTTCLSAFVDERTEMSALTGALSRPRTLVNSQVLLTPPAQALQVLLPVRAGRSVSIHSDVTRRCCRRNRPELRPVAAPGRRLELAVALPVYRDGTRRPALQRSRTSPCRMPCGLAGAWSVTLGGAAAAPGVCRRKTDAHPRVSGGVSAQEKPNTRCGTGRTGNKLNFKFGRNNSDLLLNRI